MKKMQIKKALLAAAMLAGVGMAYGNNGSMNYAVVYCKATISGNYQEGSAVSVTLPPTDGYYDKYGNPLTYWNVGNVPAGGVADSWHGEGGPGRFTARNNGNIGSYFYVTSASHEYNFKEPNTSENFNFNPWSNERVDESTFGEGQHLDEIVLSPQHLQHAPWKYHLAFTTDTMAKVPTWHSLDHGWVKRGSDDNPYWVWVTDKGNYRQAAAYMGYVSAGDYLTFDLKFWAPYERSTGDSLLFTFCVEASEFPLWDHDRAVE